MKIQKILTLSFLLFTSVQAFYFDISNVDEWGLHGENQDAVIFSESDGNIGGSSTILDSSGNLVGHCPYWDGNCSDNFKVGSSIITSDSSVTRLSSKFRITEYIPSTQSSFGQASLGWWVLPNYDKDYESIGTFSIFKTGKAIGLSEDTWLTMNISYTENQKLTIQVRGNYDNETDDSLGIPSISYTGVGSFETFSFPIKALRRSDGKPLDPYYISGMNAIGFLRVEKALTEGASFPSTTPEFTEFGFKCMASGSSKGENICYTDILLNTKENQKVNILNQEVEIFSLQGEKLSTQIWTGTLKNHPQGLYLIKFDGQVMKYNHP